MTPNFFNQIIKDLEDAGFIEEKAPESHSNGYCRRWFYIRRMNPGCDVTIRTTLEHFENREGDIITCHSQLVNSKGAAIAGNNWKTWYTIAGEGVSDRRMYNASMKEALGHVIGGFEYYLVKEQKAIERKLKLLKRIEQGIRI